MFAEGEKFLAKYLGGRYQESMTPEVAKRLKEISVDPKTVAIVKPVNMTDAPSSDLTGKWSLVADAGGQQVEISVEFKQNGAAFTGDTMSAVGGGKIENGKVSGNNFTALLKADLQGQPVDFTIEGTIDGDKIKGALSNPSFGSIPFTGTKNK